MKKILIVTVLILLLMGCGGNKTQTVCKSSAKDGVELIEEINADGDKVTKLKETMKLDFSDVADVTATDIEDMGKLLGEDYEGLKGVDFDYTVVDKKIEYTVTFDYEKADLDELQEKKILTFDKEGTSKYVSLKSVIKGFEDDKLTCENK